MTNYDYSILNDKEFEEFSREILTKHLKFSFQSFKSGRDGGIDLRYSTDLNNEIIVQCKHYVKSNFSNLKRDLKKEYLKVEKLSPARYIIVVSSSLTPNQVGEIKNIFGRYILSLQDIYYKERLNSILSDNPSVEEKFHKLWITSTTILQRMLHNGTAGNSMLLKEEILDDFRRYVFSEKHHQAYEKLLTEKFLIITGKPGVGKSTLAKILIYKLLAEKGCELVEVTDSINKASDLIDFTGNRDQAVFFDDFLGAILFEVLNPRNSEGAIERFIRRLRGAKGKYLIMTSRTTIINKAVASYDYHRTIDYQENKRFVVNIDDYSRREKALILYNHLYFNNSKAFLLESIKLNQFYYKIIDHKNFNPRIIEFITSPTYTEAGDPIDYQKRVLIDLNHPHKIWKGSYENQLNSYERWLMQTLITFKGSVKIDILELSFNERLNYEVSNGAVATAESSFRQALKNLSGSYINLVRTGSNGELLTISFSNPSVGDFLKSFISQDVSILRRLLLSATSLEQFRNLKEVFNSSIEEHKHIFKKDLLNQFKKIGKLVLSTKNPNEQVIDLCYSYFQFYRAEEIQDVVKELISEKVLLSDERFHFDRFLNVVINLKDYPIGKEISSRFWNEIIFKLYSLAGNIYNYEEITILFDEYDHDQEVWLMSNENFEHLKFQLQDPISEIVSERLLEDPYSYEFYEEETSCYFNGEDYVSEYEYRLDEDIESLAEQQLEDILGDIGLKNLLVVEDLNLEKDYIKEQIESVYKESKEAQAKENYKFRKSSGFNSVDDRGDNIPDLFS